MDPATEKKEKMENPSELQKPAKISSMGATHASNFGFNNNMPQIAESISDRKDL